MNPIDIATIVMSIVLCILMAGVSLTIRLKKDWPMKIAYVSSISIMIGKLVWLVFFRLSADSGVLL